MSQHFCTLNIEKWNDFIWNIYKIFYILKYIWLSGPREYFFNHNKNVHYEKNFLKVSLKKIPLLDTVKYLFLFPLLSQVNSSFVFSLKKKIVDYYLLVSFLLRKVKEMSLKLHLNFAGAEFLLNFLFMINIILLAYPSTVTKAMPIFA